MSYEEAEIIKAIVLIILCIPPIVVLIAQDIISIIEDRKYREELKEAKILEAERRSRKLENLKLENLTLNLNENEVDNIKRYTQGQALFVCGSRRMQIEILLTEKELESFGSGGGY